MIVPVILEHVVQHHTFDSTCSRCGTISTKFKGVYANDFVFAEAKCQRW